MLDENKFVLSFDFNNKTYWAIALFERYWGDLTIKGSIVSKKSKQVVGEFTITD